MHRSSIHVSKVLYNLPNARLTIKREHFLEFFQCTHLHYPIHYVRRILFPINLVVICVPEQRSAQIHRYITKDVTEFHEDRSNSPPANLSHRTGVIHRRACQNSYLVAVAHFLTDHFKFMPGREYLPFLHFGKESYSLGDLKLKQL